jgi:hypothetical protein
MSSDTAIKSVSFEDEYHTHPPRDIIVRVPIGETCLDCNFHIRLIPSRRLTIVVPVALV